MNRRKAISVCRSARFVSSAVSVLHAKPAAPAAATAQASEPSLEDQFPDPSKAAPPHVCWHFLQGKSGKDGIAKDPARIKQVGIGGRQAFDANLANLQTPQIGGRELVFLTLAWKLPFRLAASEAELQGLQLTIAASPRWSEVSGLSLPLQDGLTKLVWSETSIASGRRFMGKLPKPRAMARPHQDVPLSDGLDAMCSGEKAQVLSQNNQDLAALPIPVSSTALPASGHYSYITQNSFLGAAVSILEQAPRVNCNLKRTLPEREGYGHECPTPES